MVQSTHPGVAAGGLTREGAAARFRSRLTTTPGRMRVAGAAILVGLLVLGVVGTGALRARQRATNAVGQQAEPVLVAAQDLYSSLADADATATNTFLLKLEPPQRRASYLADLADAARQLTTVARQGGSSQAVAVALGVINKDLPTYSGLIEAARANNRLGFPVGAAYLREGSTLMQTAILPAVGQLYQVEAQRLNRAYGSGRSLLDVIGVLLVAVAALVALLLTQLFVARRTNRVLNLPLLVASGLTVVLVAWTLLAFFGSAHRLGEARSRGSDPVQLLSSARILVARAQVDENLALVARGSGSRYLADFDAVAAELGPVDGTSGLLAEAARSVPAQGSAVFGPDGPYATYLQTHQAVVKAENSSDFATAVGLATDPASGELLASSQLSTALIGRIGQARVIFASKAAAAAHDLSALSLVVLGFVVLAIALALVGLEQRINEYR